MEDAKKSSKRFLIIYCLAIFVFAVALILITYISQSRSAAATDALQNKLTNAEQQALTTQTSLDQVLLEYESIKTSNNELTSQNAALTTEKETLSAEKIDLEAKLAASQKLTSLLNTKYNASKAEFETALNEFELGGYPALLAPDDLELYNSLK